MGNLITLDYSEATAADIASRLATVLEILEGIDDRHGDTEHTEWAVTETRLAIEWLRDHAAAVARERRERMERVVDGVEQHKARRRAEALTEAKESTT